MPRLNLSRYPNAAPVFPSLTFSPFLGRPDLLLESFYIGEQQHRLRPRRKLIHYREYPRIETKRNAIPPGQRGLVVFSSMFLRFFDTAARRARTADRKSTLDSLEIFSRRFSCFSDISAQKKRELLAERRRDTNCNFCSMSLSSSDNIPPLVSKSCVKCLPPLRFVLHTSRRCDHTVCRENGCMRTRKRNKPPPASAEVRPIANWQPFVET